MRDLALTIGFAWAFLVAPLLWAQEEYVIGPKDVLKITVWGHKDLSDLYSVSLEGTITLPLIGKVKAEGLTEVELRKQLTELLGEYLVDPQVLVSVAEYQSKKVLVLGEVNKPGAFPLKGRTTLLDAISKAEGLTKDAADQLVLVRQHPQMAGRASEVSPGASVVRLDWRKIKTGDTTENVVIENGDTIFVPKNLATFFILGEVKKPGAYPLEKEMNILEGITTAGGFTDRASPGKTKVIRPTPKGQETIQVDMNEIIKKGRREKAIPLRDGDVVIVPESFF